MSIFQRQTSKGITPEYHYKFMQQGKWYYGVCEGCTTERAALAFEKKIRETAKTASEQKNVKALIENFRDELTGGGSIPVSEAYDRYLAKPTRRIPGEYQKKRNRSYWGDFAAFMAARYPDVGNLADVTTRQAEEYISMLRDSGAFIKDISFSRQQGSRTVNATYRSAADQLSPRTVNARHKAVKAVFSRLAADAGMFHNPFDIPVLTQHTISRDAFTDMELRRIGDNISMPYTRPIFIIGLCTGLTLGDICLLRWDEIADGWISNKRRRKTGVMLDIPVMPPLAAFLEEQRRITGGGMYVAPELADMYQRNPAGVFYRVRKFLRQLDIQTSITPDGRSRAVPVKSAHAMRHTFAYLAGVYNIPLPIVQSVLGHMSPEMTALYQRHATREAKARFLRQMPNVLGAPTAGALPAPVDPEQADRDRLRLLAASMPIERVRVILASLE
ncbi:MAG: tyrosine-type recombinase/integrase [Lentisphaeria bacterium]|nr:tyrosine-type recombinase/integrase [Lentisphaeria bacterium]